MAQAPRAVARPAAPSGVPPVAAQAQHVEDYTVYPLNFLALAPGVTANGAVNIQADSAFRWTKATFFADIAAAAQTQATQVIPLCTVDITDTGSGRRLFNGTPVPLPAVFGFGYLPFILPVSRIFEARSSIQVTIANFDVAATYNIRLAFIGTKIFTYGQ